MSRATANCVVLLNHASSVVQVSSLRKTAPWYCLAIVLAVIDQYSKTLAVEALAYGEQLFVTKYFNWTLLHNTGAAFSFLSDAGGWQNGFFCTIATAVSGYIIYWLYQTPGSARWQALALSLMLSGALGNLYDRLTRGYVIDFIQVHYQQYYWPAFNVADSAICVGAGILIATSLFSKPTNVDGNDGVKSNDPVKKD